MGSGPNVWFCISVSFSVSKSLMMELWALDSRSK
jgi:hypothetical protein